MSAIETVTAFAAAPDGKVHKKHTQKKPVGGNDVGIRVTHSGVCGTDLHYLHADMVLGHEGVGIVEEVGKNVTKLKPGDKAGWGWVYGGCGECDQCKAGYHFHCRNSPQFYGAADTEQGSFSTYAVKPESHVSKIPDGIDLEVAAPFLCAGQTVMTPLLRRGVKKGDRIGIVGVGGLGHLAIQFAARMGGEVVVFSGTEDKRGEAMSFGAKEFYVSKDLNTTKPEKELDVLLVTTAKHPDWATYLPLMNAFGAIYPLTIDFAPLVIPFQPFLQKEISFVSSCTATPEETKAMLEFAAEHGIKPVIETFPMSVEGATQAIDHLNSGKLRYRAVLEVKA